MIANYESERVTLHVGKLGISTVDFGFDHIAVDRLPYGGSALVSSAVRLDDRMFDGPIVVRAGRLLERAKRFRK